MVWAIWNTRNDFVVNKPKKNSFLHVIPMATHWIRMWFYLQQEELREVMDSGCKPFGDGSSEFIQPVRLAITS
jgi:hypothetical protein